MDLTILLPTHNRPHLYQRALTSVLNQIPKGVQVIVNNDSNDITEISHPQVKYYYNNYNNLSDVYKFLLSTATTSYVYFLEDDDYLKNGFFNVLNQHLTDNYDIISGNYWPTFNDEHILKTHTNGIYTEQEQFVNALDYKYLQLSKFIFKRKRIVNYNFKKDSNVHNDIDLVLHAVSESDKFICLPDVLYFQTVDGKDNISFEQFSAVEKDLSFLKNYKWNIQYEDS